MATTPINIRFARHEAPVLTVTMNPTTNITGWTFTFTLRKIGSSALITVSGVITNAAGGVFTVSLTKAQTSSIAKNAYDYDIWRTNSGSEARLVYGTVTLEDQAWAT